MKIRRLKLSNNLPVILADLGATKTVAVLVLVHTGSRQESKAQAGLSHFLEHLVFKGTVSWPSAQALTHLIDSLGADYNAYTGKEVTGFYIKAAAEHLPIMLKVLAEMVWQPILDQDEMKREKEVIVQEINMYEDNPIMYVEDLLEQQIFGQQPLGRLISGSRESVRQLTAKAVKKYSVDFYHPANMLLAVAGKISAKTLTLIKDNFGINRTKKSLPKFICPVMKPTKNRVALKYKETEQVQLALGMPALPLRHKDMLVLEVLATILGGNMSSRLFSRLREQEGLCYFIKAGVQAYEQAGLLIIQSGLDKDRLPRAMELLKEELIKIKEQTISGVELKKAKDFLKGKILLSLEDSAGVADWLGRQVMMEHKLETIDQLLKKLDKVTPQDLSRVARAVIKPECYNLAVIGPYRDIKLLHNLLN